MQLLPSYDTKLFTDIYNNATDFATDYASIGLGGITDSTLITKLFYLLYAKFGNSPIANLDETQFKYKLFSTVFMYGPAWEKRLDIQSKLRAISDADLVKGAKVIYNHAFRNTMIPLVTLIGGSLPGLFSGALITETLYAIPGIGYASYHSMVHGDIPFSMFYLVFMSVLTLLGNLISDILYAVVDPRVRIAQERRHLL